jgi:LPXTG-motif cell wall-anchored protein
MSWAAVNVTLRVGGAMRAGSPTAHSDIPRSGSLPVTGAALVTLVAAAIAMVVLGTLFLVRAREEQQ